MSVVRWVTRGEILHLAGHVDELSGVATLAITERHFLEPGHDDAPGLAGHGTPVRNVIVTLVTCDKSAGFAPYRAVPSGALAAGKGAGPVPVVLRLQEFLATEDSSPTSDRK